MEDFEKLVEALKESSINIPDEVQSIDDLIIAVKASPCRRGKGGKSGNAKEPVRMSLDRERARAVDVADAFHATPTTVGFVKPLTRARAIANSQQNHSRVQ